MTAESSKRDWLMSLLTEHEASLGRYAARIVQDRDLARDLVQETFLRLWQSDAAEVGTHPAPWLYTVCRNLCFDHLRKERRMVPSSPMSEEWPAVLPEAGVQDEVSRVLGALTHLPANQQEVIRLKFQGGLSYKDISRITGHSISHVGVLIHAGVKTLRATLAPESQGPSAKKGGAK